jgi:CRP/FNR family transcriptional regulator, cyclic AMP receptor protein
VSGYRGRLAAAHPDLFRLAQMAGERRTFPRGEEITAAGWEHPRAGIVVIRRGFLATVASAPSGQWTLLAIHGPGDLVGEEVLFGEPAMAEARGVRTLTRGSAAWVLPSRFRTLLNRHPQGWAVLARTLHQRLLAAEERICLMAGANADQRLAVFLVQLLGCGVPVEQEEGGLVVPLGLTQAELAYWVGTSRETVERILSGWVAREMVTTRRRTLVVRDLTSLQRIAGMRSAGPARAA